MQLVVLCVTSSAKVVAIPGSSFEATSDQLYMQSFVVPSIVLNAIHCSALSCAMCA
jgi:hypothetical protein